MGILVGDSKTFSNGLVLSNFIISVKGSIRGIEKKKGMDENGNPSIVYVILYTIYYYANELAYANGLNYVDSESTIFSLSEEQLSSNIFALLYSDIASRYNLVTNLL